MADAGDIKATIERYWAAFSEGDRDGWLGCFADGAWIEDPVGTPRRDGKDSIGEFYDQSHSMADSIALVPGGVLNICGNEAAFTMQARPTIGGDVYAVDIIDAMTFDDDARITTMKAYWDPAAMRPI
jgi:steroid delta-isomerase